MNINQLQYFITLAKYEHYTKAADELAITQPSLSNAIKLMEEELGTCLFEKRGRNVVLTKYGRLFLEYAKESMQTLGTGIKKVQELNSATSGTIDIGYIYTLGSKFMPKLVADFLRKDQELTVQFHFDVGSTTKILAGLKEEKYDIAFCSRKEKEPGICFLPIGKEELVVVVPKGHPLSGKKEVSLLETLPYPQVYFSKTSGLRPVIDGLFAQLENKNGPERAYEVEEDSFMAGLVAEGFGIAVMPRIPLLDTMEVSVLTLKEPSYERKIYMAYMKDKYMAPVTAKFVDFVLQETGK